MCVCAPQGEVRVELWADGGPDGGVGLRVGAHAHAHKHSGFPTPQPHKGRAGPRPPPSREGPWDRQGCGHACGPLYVCVMQLIEYVCASMCVCLGEQE